MEGEVCGRRGEGAHWRTIDVGWTRDGSTLPFLGTVFFLPGVMRPRLRLCTASTSDGHQVGNVLDMASGDSSKTIRFLPASAVSALIMREKKAIHSSFARPAIMSSSCWPI